jgi:hypothetical protein
MSCDEELIIDIMIVYENIIMYTNPKFILNWKYHICGNVNYDECCIQKGNGDNYEKVLLQYGSQWKFIRSLYLSCFNISLLYWIDYQHFKYLNMQRKINTLLISPYNFLQFLLTNTTQTQVIQVRPCGLRLYTQAPKLSSITSITSHLHFTPTWNKLHPIRTFLSDFLPFT